MPEPLRLTFNVAEDEELRKYLKSLIKNQILSTTREDFDNTIKENILTKMDKVDKYIENMDIAREVRNVIKTLLENEIGSKFSIYSSGCSFLTGIIKERVTGYIDKILEEPNVKEYTLHQIKQAVTIKIDKLKLMEVKL